MSDLPLTLDLPDLAPARMVNEFAYCPRLAYLEWVQGDFEDNADTAEGRFRHRVVDKEGGHLPPPLHLPIPAQSVSSTASSSGDGGTVGVIHTRSVWLSAPDEFITAKMDLIEGQGALV